MSAPNVFGGGGCAGLRHGARTRVVRAAQSVAETLERRRLLNAIVAPADPVAGPVVSPLAPRPGHSFYVQGSASTWDQNSAITPNALNDLILHAAPIDSNYVPCCEAVTAPGGVTNPTLPNSIRILTNGTTQSLISSGGSLDQAGTPDGSVSDPSNPTNVIADVNTPWHATYSLGNNPGGYDITEIDSITGHQDFRTQQHIDIEVEPVGTNQFMSLSGGQGFSFTQTGGSLPVTLGKGSAQMAIISDVPGTPIVTNTRAIRFDNLPGDVAFFRELVVTGTPSAPPTHLPAAPTRLSATVDPSVGGVRLTWTDNADNETGYLIERSTSLAGPFSAIGSAPAVDGTGGTGTFLDTTLAATGSYYYQVAVVGADVGNSPPLSNVAGPVAITRLFGAEGHYYSQGFWAGPVALSQLVVGPIDFTWPSGSVASSVRGFANSAAFTGKVTTNDAGMYTFVSNTDDDGYLYVNGVLVSADPGRHGPEDATRLTPISLAANSSYDFVFLENNDQAGAAAQMEWITPAMAASGPNVRPVIVPLTNLSPFSDVPQAPANLALDATVVPNPSGSRVDLEFTDNNVAVVHFLLERSDDGGQTWATVNQTDPGSASQNSSGALVPATLKIEDATVLPGQSYQYRAVAVNFDGTSAPSNVGSVTTPPTFQAPGVEGRFYNGEIASADDGQDPRKFAVAGFNPTEFVADASGISPGAAGPIDSNLGNGSPDPLPFPDIPRVHTDSYATVWTGKIVTDQAGAYTFVTNSDDDGYMWVNGVLVSADPGSHPQKDPATVAPLTLAAATAYNFLMVQQQLSGGSGIHASWIEPGQSAITVIPSYSPPLLGHPGRGGFEQVMDAPHQQVIDPSTGAYTIDTPAASAAGNLTISAASATGVILNWADQSPSELWFEIQRTSGDPNSPTATWTTVGQAGFNTGTFTDLTATDSSAAKVYSYRVRGVNFDAAGPWSNVAATNDVTLPTPAIVAQACMAGVVRLLIAGQSPNSSGFQVQYSTDGSQWVDASGSPAPNTAQAFDVTGLDPGTVYSFRVRNLGGPGAPGPSPFSNVVTASGGGPEPINFGAGFNATATLQLNGSAKITGAAAAAPNALQLTANLQSLWGSAYATSVQNITSFQARFDFVFPQPGGPGSDGFTFVIQNDPAGLAAPANPQSGGALGYAGIHDSVAIKFDLYNNSGEGFDSTGLFVDGDYPSVPQGGNPADASLDMTPSGVNLHNPGDKFETTLLYDGTNLRETVTDLTTGAVFTHSYAVNIPQIVGGMCAYVGFTGATGLGTAEQDITRWTFVGTPATVSGTGGNDTITLKRDPDGTDIDWTMNGGPTALVPAASPSGLTIVGNGGADTIVLDNSNGNPLPTLLRLNGNFSMQGLAGLAFGQTMDIIAGTLQIAYHGPSPLAAIQGYLHSGNDAERWDGTGITSSTAASTPGLAVADVDSGSAIVLSLRRFGDANGDGTVAFNDLLILAQNYAHSGAGIDWSKGDFNYDGSVDFADLVVLAQNYGRTAPASPALQAASPSPAADWEALKKLKRPSLRRR